LIGWVNSSATLNFVAPEIRSFADKRCVAFATDRVNAYQRWPRSVRLFGCLVGFGLVMRRQEKIALRDRAQRVLDLRVAESRIADGDTLFRFCRSGVLHRRRK
jgi:hypothetical protein